MTVACDIIIDDQFRRLIPPPTADELEQLEANLVADGCRDPLVVWSGHGILLDGHNRLEICTRRGIAYNVAEVDLEDREAAENWIDTNQLGRRNLSPDGASLLRGRIYNRQKKAEGGRADRELWGGQNVHPKTSEILSTQFGVDERTIRRDGQFAASVEKLRDVAPELEREIVAGDAPARKDVIAAAKVVETEPDKAREILSKPHVSFNSGDNEWYTPQEIIERVRKVLGHIDLDPASHEEANGVIQADTFFSAEDDGLSQPWAGRIWMNPPYASELIGKFIDKLVEHVNKNDVTEACVLVNNATETRWFQSLMSVASAVCFPAGRIKFWHPRKVATPLQGQALVYVGAHREKFATEFMQIGTAMLVVCEPIEHCDTCKYKLFSSECGDRRGRSVDEVTEKEYWRATGRCYFWADPSESDDDDDSDDGDGEVSVSGEN